MTRAALLLVACVVAAVALWPVPPRVDVGGPPPPLPFPGEGTGVHCCLAV